MQIMSKRLSITVSESLLEALKATANLRDRSVSNLAAHLIASSLFPEGGAIVIAPRGGRRAKAGRKAS
jgi:CopG-like RHH_1 or ribbon-helix-helix domain, RHH_5